MKIKDQELTDLLNRVEGWEKDPIKVKIYKNSIDQFIHEFPGLKSGTKRVDNEIIYWFYLKYCKQHGFEVLHHTPFFMLFAKHFKRAKAQAQHRSYYLDNTPFQITQEEYDELFRNKIYRLETWPKRSAKGKHAAKVKKEKVRQRKKLAKLKEKLKRKHSKPEIKSETSDSTDESSQK